MVSAPDVRVTYGPAGRDTLSAIADAARAKTPPQTSSPDLSFEMAPAGRETLAVLVGETRRHVATDIRPAMSTLDYGESDHASLAPEIEVSEQPAGRETLAAIASALGADPEASRRRRVATRGFDEVSQVRSVEVGRDTLDALARAVAHEPSPESGVAPGFEIFETASFLVRATDLTRLSTDAQRRAFVQERLLHRLPVTEASDIDRVDATPFTEKNTVVLRVWCRVRPRV